MCVLHHIAISVDDIAKYQKLFERLGMTVQRKNGISPNQQIWFHEGIQLKENFSSLKNGTNIDYIALQCSDIENVVKVAIENGCSLDSRGDNWFVLPNGIRVEILSN